jgi:hypothetical protein
MRLPRDRHAARSVSKRAQLRRLCATKSRVRSTAILHGKFEPQSNNYDKSNLNRLVGRRSRPRALTPPPKVRHLGTGTTTGTATTTRRPDCWKTEPDAVDLGRRDGTRFTKPRVTRERPQIIGPIVT